MPLVRVDVISIGCLSRNLLWGEQESLRTPHATTTLIRAGKRHILVDPGLPAPVIGARLYERTGLKPEQIDTVFLTNYRPAHRVTRHSRLFLTPVPAMRSSTLFCGVMRWLAAPCD